MTEPLRWARQQAGCVPDLAAILSDPGVEPAAAEAVAALGAGSDRSGADVWSTILTLLRPWEDPSVAKATADPLWSPGDLLDGGMTTLFVTSGTDSARLAPLYACLIDEVIEAVKVKALRDGRLRPGLLLALDEVANIAPIGDLPGLLSVLGGMGATVLTAWQSVGQMTERYGPSGAATILGNSGSQVWGASSDPDTIRRLGDVLGTREITQQSTSSDPRRGGFLSGNQPTSISTSTTRVAAMDASEIRTMSRPLLLVDGLPPAQLTLRFHDRDRHLRALSGLPEPAPDEAAEPTPESPEPAAELDMDVPAPAEGAVPADDWWADLEQKEKERTT